MESVRPCEAKVSLGDRKITFKPRLEISSRHARWGELAVTRPPQKPLGVERNEPQPWELPNINHDDTLDSLDRGIHIVKRCAPAGADVLGLLELDPGPGQATDADIEPTYCAERDTCIGPRMVAAGMLSVGEEPLTPNFCEPRRDTGIAELRDHVLWREFQRRSDLGDERSAHQIVSGSLGSSDNGFESAYGCVGIIAVNLNADPIAAKVLGRNEGCPGSRERVQDCSSLNSVQLDAPFGKTDREPGRMVELLGFRADRLVRDEPHVPSTAPVSGMSPSGDIGFVLERNTDGKTIYFDFSCLGEVKNQFVVVIKIALAAIGLKWPTVSEPILTDLAHMIWFCRMNASLNAAATSKDIQGSELTLPTLRKKEPSGRSTRAISRPISESQSR